MVLLTSSHGFPVVANSFSMRSLWSACGFSRHPEEMIDILLAFLICLGGSLREVLGFRVKEF